MRNTAVRPTKRALADLGINVPTADVMLHDIEHPDIQKIQEIPEAVAGGVADPVLCIKDRRW